MKRKKLKLQTAFWLTLFFGVGAAYFFWLVWDKLTTFIGDTNTALMVVGGIVLVGILLGFLSIKKIAERFT